MKSLVTLVTAVWLVAATGVAAQAEVGAPSATVLADMGLAKLQILSDHEATAIRGRGYEPGSQLSGWEHFKKSKDDFHGHVADFCEKIKDHKFKGTDGFKKTKENYQKHVQKFQDAIAAIHHRVH